DAVFDHVEDDFSDVFAGVNAPFTQNRRHHGAKAVEGELAQAVQKLLAVDMLVVALGAAEGALCVLESLLHKDVGFVRVTGVRRRNLPDVVFEIYWSHIKFSPQWRGI